MTIIITQKPWPLVTQKAHAIKNNDKLITFDWIISKQSIIEVFLCNWGSATGTNRQMHNLVSSNSAHKT